MRNNLLIKLNLVVFTLVLTSVNAAYSLPKKLEPLSPSISKLLLVMIGIIFFLGLIFIGLTIYNKYFIAKNLANYHLKKYNLADSVDKDDAILNYVTKNKLR